MKRWFVSGFKGTINRGDLESPSAPGRLLCCVKSPQGTGLGAAGKRRRFPHPHRPRRPGPRVSSPRPRQAPGWKGRGRTSLSPSRPPVWESQVEGQLPRSQRVTALGPGKAPPCPSFPPQQRLERAVSEFLHCPLRHPHTPCCTLPASGLTGVLGKEMPNAFHKLPGVIKPHTPLQQAHSSDHTGPS